MPNYYVSATGNDSTGDGSAANPWKTIGKAIGSSPAITLPGSGTTTLWLRGGDIFREAVTLGLSPGSANPLVIQGDIDGAAFTGAGGSGVAGVVSWRAWTSATTPINSPCLTTLSKGNFTVKGISFLGGSYANGNVLRLIDATALEFADCEIIGGGISGGSGRMVDVAVPIGAGGFRFRRCDFESSGSGTGRGLMFTSSRDDADWSVDTLIESCRFRGVIRCIELALGGGSKTGSAVGFKVACCTFAAVYTAVFVGPNVPANAATVTGCVVTSGTQPLYATAAGQMTEDYNILNGATLRTNVTAGAHSLDTIEPALNLERVRVGGSAPRPYLEPLAGSTFLGFVPRPAGVTVDLYGRSRPDPCAAGCLERVDPPAPPVSATYIFQTEG